jgi:hypothetical protein
MNNPITFEDELAGVGGFVEHEDAHCLDCCEALPDGEDVDGRCRPCHRDAIEASREEETAC